MSGAVVCCFSLLYSFDQRRTLQHRCPALPQKPAALSISSLSAVTRQLLRLALGDVGELTFQCFGYAGVQGASG